MNVVKSRVADDVIAMVTASEQVSMDVAMALSELNRDVLVAVSKYVVVDLNLPEINLIFFVKFQAQVVRINWIYL